MVLAVRLDSGSLAGEVVEVLSEVVDRIDQLELQTDDFDKMIDDCKKLAEFSNVCLHNRKSGLILAEISIFAAVKEKEKLLACEKLLDGLAENNKDNDVDFLRCRARLLAKQGGFDEAAELWAQICGIRKSESASANQRNWKWWRAKFYELYCCSKQRQNGKESISHTIEVLENSFSNIPPLWAEQLSLLKKQCAAGRLMQVSPVRDREKVSNGVNNLRK